ncbi:MAG: aldo/keto reductase [Bifidobacteriaceae bacterium]|jgi:aryl-alcohol dehydrogenase-like predicted oxidoreductase|nr:aldo/keto reductase [Bifidobacteriaceae bacterium]
MKNRRIGPFTVSAIGLGSMPMSIEGRPDRAQSLRTIHAALDAGITQIDTAFGYRVPLDVEAHSEELIAEALRTWGGDSDSILVATKGGHYRYPDEPGRTWGLCGDPVWIKNCARASAKALGVDAIGLYYYHRPDPQITYQDVCGALLELIEEGTIVTAGISNANVSQIDDAIEVLGDKLVAVQNQYSPVYRWTQRELDYTAGKGIAFLPWSPLGGIGKAGALASRAAAFGQVAAAHGVSPQQVALAWELAKGDHVVPIPGASKPESILDSVKAVDLVLTPEELALLG